MALSNIFKEPRREITETIVGVLTIGIVGPTILIIDYYYAKWLADHMPHPEPADVVFCMIFVGPASLFLLVMSLVFIHAIGETICDKLQRRGIELRPKQRYR